jgi:hydroxyacylglutathione hydrolase
MNVHLFPALNDNYGFLLRDEASGCVASVDTPDGAAIERALAETGWGKLTLVLNTHHHADHTGGNLELKQRHGCAVVGPAADAERIPGIDTRASDGDALTLGATSFIVMHVPGHTRGHCAYYFPSEGAVFVGDTLFSLGCGRMFEGTKEQFHASLRSLAALPDETKVYCAHEYTASNGRFALSVEPGNAALVARCAEVDALRAKGLPSVPTTIGLEKQTNPFLRTESCELRAAVGLGADARDVDVFAALRKAKDTF